MTVTEQLVPDPAPDADAALQRRANDHLWLHFTRQSALESNASKSSAASLALIAHTFSSASLPPSAIPTFIF